MTVARFWLNTSSEIRIGGSRGRSRKWAFAPSGAGAAPAFSPANLFAAAEDGAYYDASDLSTLWTTSARTTQVASDGDPVGAWDDKSGNGYNLTQATSTKRMLYKTAGGLHWIVGDGIDDNLTNASITGLSDAHTVVAAVQPGAASSAKALLGWGDSSNAQQIVYYYDNYSGGATSGGIRCYFKGLEVYNETISTQSGITQVITALTTNGDQKARRDGIEVASNTATRTIGHTEPFFMAAYNGTAQFNNARFYAVILHENILSGADLTNAEEWAAGKAGL